MMDILNQNHLSFCIAAYFGIVATTPFHSRLSALISARKIEQAQKPTEYLSRKAQKISRRDGGGGAVLSGLIFLSL